MEKKSKKSLSCRKAFIRHLRIFVSDGMINERKEIRRSRSPRRTGEFRDDRSLCYNGFTLIELLVVVLIIGILAAVALPQYKLAVAKARMTELVTLSSAVKQAQDRYFLANGTWATKWDELDIDLTGYTVAGNILYKRNAYDMNYMHATLYAEKEALYFSGGNKDLPGILFITWFSTGAQYCYANQDNDLAKKLCKNVCKSKTLATDGSWRGCTL